MKRFIVFVLVCLSLCSCTKEPGKGGTNTIKGVIYVQEYNKDLTLKVGDPYPAQDLDVYLIYGDDEVYGDDFQTGYDGKFQFEYLQGGKYTVYVLSKSLDNRITNELVPIFKEIEISGKNKIIEVDTIQIID